MKIYFLFLLLFGLTECLRSAPLEPVDTVPKEKSSPTSVLKTIAHSYTHKHAPLVKTLPNPGKNNTSSSFSSVPIPVSKPAIEPVPESTPPATIQKVVQPELLLQANRTSRVNSRYSKNSTYLFREHHSGHRMNGTNEVAPWQLRREQPQPQHLRGHQLDKHRPSN